MNVSTRALAVAVAVALAAPTAALAMDRGHAEQHARGVVARYKAKAAEPVSVQDCVGPAGDPAPGTQAWQQRDYVNQYCATERLLDEYGSPAFGATFWAETPAIYAGQNVAMLTNPTHPHATLGQLVPGGSTTDPYRTIDRWTASGRGRVDAVS